MSTVIAINRRARSTEQKALRRQVILEAAETYFKEVGYEAFSMAKLGKRSGVAKGTIYLYFETKEALFLSLYDQSLMRWSRGFINALSDDMTSESYARLLYRRALADGIFLPLLIRLEHVIEHNVAIPRVIESKQIFIEQVEGVAKRSAAALQLSTAEAIEVVKTMGVLLIGATQTDQSPSLADEALPPEVQDLIAGFSSEPLFIKNAVRIIEGIRAEASLNPSTNSAQQTLG